MIKIIFSLGLIFAETTQTQAPAVDLLKQNLSENITSVQTRIEGLNKNLTCRTKNDCDVLGLGHKLCGGPETFIVVSKKNPSYNALVHEAKTHRSLRREYQTKYSQGMMGTCSMAQPPAVLCQARRCTAAN